MEWCTDFCLSCDQQTNGGAYCSQMCRMADLDRVHADAAFEPSSPSSTTSSASSSPRSPFQLAPAIDFSAYKTSNNMFAFDLTYLASTTQRRERTPLQRSSTSPTIGEKPSSSQLRSSPSGTSLSSIQSSQSTRPNLSQQSRNDLSAYANSFDHVRDLRRRRSLY